MLLVRLFVQMRESLCKPLLSRLDVAALLLHPSPELQQGLVRGRRHLLTIV